jgi:hypothetical protein
MLDSLVASGLALFIIPYSLLTTSFLRFRLGLRACWSFRR